MRRIAARARPPRQRGSQSGRPSRDIGSAKSTTAWYSAKPATMAPAACRPSARPNRLRQMIAAASWPIAASTSTGVPEGSRAHSARHSATVSVTGGSSSAMREACVTGAISRRRSRHSAPSLANMLSPTSGTRAKRNCGLFRWKTSCLSTKASCTVAGLLTSTMSRLSTRVVSRSRS